MHLTRIPVSKFWIIIDDGKKSLSLLKCYFNVHSYLGKMFQLNICFSDRWFNHQAETASNDSLNVPKELFKILWIWKYRWTIWDTQKLGGGFNYLLCSPLPGVTNHFGQYFLDGLESPTSHRFRCWIYKVGVSKLRRHECHSSIDTRPSASVLGAPSHLRKLDGYI